MSRRRNLYVGRSGQMAVMAELLWRGWNVALPEVDVGEDVFVVKDETGDLWRVQVKTVTAQELRDGYAATFNIALDQLRTPRTPDLIYVFAIRGVRAWEPFVIIDRATLHEEHALHQVGTASAGRVVLRFVSDGSTLRCSGRSFQPHQDNWSLWPLLPH